MVVCVTGRIAVSHSPFVEISPIVGILIIILKIAYGGAIRTLILLTKNRMEKIATGVVEMAGYMQLLYGYWMKSLLMKHIARII